MDDEENRVLATLPEEKNQAIKSEFIKQKQAVNKMWPKIQSTFTGAVVDAFQSTFRWGGLLMLLGVICLFQ